jgi:hypothetical protein
MKYYIGIVVLFAFLFSCAEKEEKKDGSSTGAVKELKDGMILDGKSTALYTGKPGQLVIVSDNTIYTDEVAILFDSIFGQFIRPYYPPEPKFEIFTRTQDDFEKGSKSLRNLIFLELDPTIPEGEPMLIIKKNYYSETQLIAEFSANNMNDLYALIEERLEKVYDLFDTQEWKREYLRHKKANNQVIKKKLREQFGIEFEIQSKAHYENKDNMYAHIILPERSRQMELEAGGGYNSTKANFIQSGIMIWQYDFKDSSQLLPENLMRARDSILKKYAKHEIDGIYMGTQDHPAVLPIHEKFQIGDIVGYQFRGLFKFTGIMEPSGGKFWSFHFLHPKTNRIVAVSGYLDAPPTMSASLDIRKIQSILYSLKIVD